jgi:hypothetical protein
MKTLKIEDVEFELIAEYESIPVRGNAIASGDNEFDKKVEDEIIERLDSGDVWAWASVEVKAKYKGLKASDFLGACCYKDENDFKQPGGYYDDMKKIAFDALKKQVDEILSELCEG